MKQLKSAFLVAVGTALAAVDKVKEQAGAVRVAGVGFGVLALAWANEKAKLVVPFYGDLVSRVRGKVHEIFS